MTPAALLLIDPAELDALRARVLAGEQPSEAERGIIAAALAQAARAAQGSKAAAHERRNGAVRALVAAHFPIGAQRTRARQASDSIARYAASAWRADRRLPTCPYGAETLAAACWAVMRALGEAPSFTTVRRAIGWPTFPNEMGHEIGDGDRNTSEAA